MKIILDPGHGERDYGGGTNKYWKEKNMTLKISLYQYKRLKELGVDVELTRDEDKYIDSTKRTDIVKNSNADICVSNHINSYKSTAKGAETIYSIYSDGKLASSILDNLVSEGAYRRRVFCKQHPRNAKQDYYYMHRLTGSVETVIVEYGFASNKEDTQKILDNWQNYAEAVIKALCEYIDVEYKLPQNIHWAEEYYDKLANVYNVEISEKRFDDSMSRGECFALMCKVLDSMVK
ncbi:MAG: N-acetylmuramoyl-L-alanine amidase [Firmicutes bacterium]|nr:N-acetylmuramoyl-L-alanine amidase [Bacillota bacterium]